MKRAPLALATLALPTAAIAAAPDTGWGALVLIAACIVLGAVTLVFVVIGWGVSAKSNRRGQYALIVGAVPISALVLLGLYEQVQKSVMFKLSERFAHVAQVHIDASCKVQDSRDRLRLGGGLIGVQVVVDETFSPLLVADAVAYTPLERIAMAFSLDDTYRRSLTLVRFHQSFAKSFAAGTPLLADVNAIDYFERVSAGRLYGTGTRNYLLSPASPVSEKVRLDVERMQVGNDRVSVIVDRTAATHRLEISDVSTLEDRLNWTSRLRARVKDLRSNTPERSGEFLLPVLAPYLNLPQPVKLCSSNGYATEARDSRFIWLGYVLREISG